MGENGKNTFQWSADRFLERKCEDKRSPDFQLWGEKCSLHVPVISTCSICSVYYHLYLETACQSTCNDERSIKLSLIGRNGKVFASNKSLIQMSADQSFLLMLIKFRKNENDLLSEGTLTVRLSWHEARDEKRPTEMLENLSRDLSLFHLSNTNTDCVLKVGGTKLPAHRMILCARSEVFSDMFRHETSENRTGVVDILDVEADIMSDFLHYIYSGTVQGLTPLTAAPLFVVAEKYGLPLLQEACLSFLMDNLTIGNVCDAAVLADTYEKRELEKKVVQYIGERMADVQSSAEWNTFTRNKHSLAIELLFSLIAYKDSKKATS